MSGELWHARFAMSGALSERLRPKKVAAGGALSRGDVKGYGAESPDFESWRCVADAGHQGCQFVGPEEAGYRPRQVGVGSGIAGDQTADAGQHIAEIKAIETAEQARGRLH